MKAKLTRRQREQLLAIAGVSKPSIQSYYYGRTNVVNRSLSEKGLIERSSIHHGSPWILTDKGTQLVKSLTEKQQPVDSPSRKMFTQEHLLSVVNQRKHSTVRPTPGQTVIKVDRSHPVLGNRHVLHNSDNVTARAAVIEAYRQDLESDKQSNGPMAQAIKEIAQRVKNGESIALACWCAPLPCHADLIKEAVQTLLTE